MKELLRPISLLLIPFLMSCGNPDKLKPSSNESSRPSDYLFVWAGAENENESDFLAVIDANPDSPDYGDIISSVQAGVKGAAHHSEHVMPRGDSLFVNSFEAGKSFIINLSDPLNPRIAATLAPMKEFTYPHTFERLPNGNVLTTFQTKGEGNERAGGLVELDSAGNFVQSVDVENAVDPDLRAYSVTAIPSLDLAVSTTSDMRAEKNAYSFQTWRLSDLTPLRTVLLPEGSKGYEHKDPSEVRVLSDGKTAMLATFTCSLYLLHDLTSDSPRAELVYSFPWSSYDTDECGIPLTRGNFWIQTYAHSRGSAVYSLDISDPSHPVVVDSLTWAGDWWPHWISAEPEGNRVVLTSSTGETRYKVLIFTLDSETGEMDFDETFRKLGSTDRGVSFSRSDWPHGKAGPAKPHGAVFSRPAFNLEN
jgi:hypothetical protein